MDITYEQHYLQTLPTDCESVGKFSITYQLLPTNSESVGKFNITYQLLSMDLYYLPTITHESLLRTITHESLLPTNYYHNNYIYNIKNINII